MYQNSPYNYIEVIAIDYSGYDSLGSPDTRSGLLPSVLLYMRTITILKIA